MVEASPLAYLPLSQPIGELFMPTTRIKPTIETYLSAKPGQKRSTIDGSSKPMTIGQLARRGGVSIKALREYERLGLLYTLGRSESNYRLFDLSTVWCLQVIRALRALGLTLKDIQEISAIYCDQPEEPIGPHLEEKLNRVLARVEAQISDLQALRQRIFDFQTTHALALTGKTDLDLYASDPRRRAVKTKIPLDSPPEGRVYTLPKHPSRRVHHEQHTRT